MKVKAREIMLLSLFAIFLATPVFAGTSGKIAGKVIDADTREALPGVNVIIEGLSLGAATNTEGEFFILRVPPGKHTVSASMIGYKSIRVENVQVSLDKTTTVDFTLPTTVLDLGESVTIIATRPLVERDLTSTSTTISADVISRMPVQTLQDVVNLQAGVVEGHFRGGRSGEVAYLLDGVSLNDVYSGDNALVIESNAIQELQVISGTFNAEYGQAMSGIINVVTKEGGDVFHGKISSYLGDYVSNHKDIFWNIDKFNPTYNVEASLNGPLPFSGKKITFFAATRYQDSEGFLYGKEFFVPSDSSNFPSTDVSDWYIESHGKALKFNTQEQLNQAADSVASAAKSVAMNPSKRFTGQLKLTYKPSPSNKLDFEGLFQTRENREFDPLFRYNPNGDYERRQNTWNSSLNYTRVVNERTYLTFKVSRFDNDYKQYAYKDPYDSRYVNPVLLDAASGNAFNTGGQKMWHFYRNTTTSLARLDLTSQMDKHHQIKIGSEARMHRLWLRAFEIRLNRDTNWKPFIPAQTVNVQNNDEYLYHPIEASAYIQDKIELEYMVVNAGVRFENFRANGNRPEDYQAPNRAQIDIDGMSSQISPRFGLSYPITDRGAIHVSYGQFFQIPNFEYLYTNPDYELYSTSDYGTTDPPERQPNAIGNSELKPQKTTMYEIGLQQQLATDISLALTTYFKDIRNLLGTEILHSITGIRYARYINRDYGNVKGITLSLEKRVSSGFGATIDYTYQIARGNASDPASAFLDVQAGREPQKQIVPLDWDRTHSLNISTTLGDPNDYSLSIIGRMGSGLPYTPTQQNVRTAVENSERKPAFYTFDLHAFKRFEYKGPDFVLFMQVLNLFDQKNENDVYSDTGSANYTLSAANAGTVFGVNSVEQFITRPDFYSAPRQILLGFSFEF